MIEGKVEMKEEGWHEVEGEISRQEGNIMEARERKLMDVGWKKE